MIKQSTGDNEEARLAAHAVVGSVLAHLQGNSALAGGAGALTGEIAADLIMQQLYPGKMVSELSETEKQTISALSTLAAGLAGGLTGDSSADAVAGAQAGKNAVENNALGLALKGCGIAAPCRSLIAKQVLEIGVKAGITGIVAKEIADKISEDDLDHLVTLTMMGNDEITEKYLNSLQDKYAPDTASAPNIGKDLTDEQKTELGGVGSGTPGGFEPEKPKTDYKSDLQKGDQIDLSTFNQRKAISGSKGEFIDPKTGWRISPDRAGNNSHGGSAWKLLDKNGNRVATLDQNGNVLRK
ncbi:hemagglutinin-like secreted protein [Yersinia similis]|nr:hemagglutinin-like secreted protein [Yersinia similis]